MQTEGRRRDFGLGSLRDVSLAEARDAAADLRRQVRRGGDPVAEKRAGRKIIPSFETAARACYESMRAGWKNKRHESWISSLSNHVFPMIGSLRKIPPERDGTQPFMQHQNRQGFGRTAPGFYFQRNAVNGDSFHHVPRN
jgi:hypothetical protein